jgi:hypothetical protein
MGMRTSLLDPSEVQLCIAGIAEKRPDLEYLPPGDVDIKWDECLGEGGFCTAYKADWGGVARARYLAVCV